MIPEIVMQCRNVWDSVLYVPKNYKGKPFFYENEGSFFAVSEKVAEAALLGLGVRWLVDNTTPQSCEVAKGRSGKTKSNWCGFYIDGEGQLIKDDSDIAAVYEAIRMVMDSK